MRTGRVFTLEAIATCEQIGHRKVWIRSWHDVSFRECERCGATDWVEASMTELAAARAAVAGVEGRMQPELSAALSTAAASMFVANDHGPVHYSARSFGQMQVAERNAEILLQCSVPGAKQRDVAARFGLSEQSVSKIVRQARAAAVTP